MVNKIDIRQVKSEFKKKFPENSLNEILENTPDDLSPEEFLTMVKLWIKIAKKGGRK